MPAYYVFGDGSKQLVVLWAAGTGVLALALSTSFMHRKFNRPVVRNGKVSVPTYDGRIDVYGLA